MTNTYYRISWRDSSGLPIKEVTTKNQNFALKLADQLGGKCKLEMLEIKLTNFRSLSLKGGY
jgi:hypothetical protein